MRTLLLLPFLCLAMVGCFSDKPPPDEDKLVSDHDLLQGRWKYEFSECGNEKHVGKGATITIKGDTVIYPWYKKYKSLTFKLNPARRPKAVDITSENGPLKAIYELDGNTLRVCIPQFLGKASWSNHKRPYDFTTPGTPTQFHVIGTFKRVTNPN